MTKRYLLLFFIVALIAITGCSRDMVINVDGMPISNHEYNLTNPETKIRAVFVLAAYLREYEGDEYIVKPRYLDALHANRIDSEEIEELILHIKVINLRKVSFATSWEITGPDNQQLSGFLYDGRLSRKDFYIKMPIAVPGDYVFSFRIDDAAGDDLFSLPQMRYKMKGGTNHQAKSDAK